MNKETNGVIVNCKAGRRIRYHIKPGLHHCNVHFTHRDRTKSCSDRVQNKNKKKQCGCNEDKISFCCDCKNLLFTIINTEYDLKSLKTIIQTTEQDHEYTLNDGDTLDINDRSTGQMNMRLLFKDGKAFIQSPEKVSMELKEDKK